jgi:hypothetical protein
VTAADELPLDDPRWLPLHDVVVRVCRRTEHLGLAAIDVTDALAAGRIRAMQRSRTERELPPASYWGNILVLGKDFHAIVAKPDGLRVAYFNSAGIPTTGPLTAIYAWWPDCHKVWPELWHEPEPEPKLGESQGGRGKWKVTARAELRRLGGKRAKDMHNSWQLRKHLEAVCAKKGTPTPKDPGHIYEEIKAFLKRK